MISGKSDSTEIPKLICASRNRPASAGVGQYGLSRRFVGLSNKMLLVVLVIHNVSLSNIAEGNRSGH